VLLKNLWFFFFGFIYILGAIVFQIDALFTSDAFSVPKAILALPFSQDVNSSNEDKRIVPVKEKKKILKKRIKKTASHPAPPLRCVFCSAGSLVPPSPASLPSAVLWNFLLFFFLFLGPRGERLLWKCWYWLLYYFSIRGPVRAHLWENIFSHVHYIYIYIYNDPYILYIYGGREKESRIRPIRAFE